MRIQNEIEIQKLEFDYFLFCINEKVREMQMINEGFVIHNIKLKRVLSEMKQLQIKQFYLPYLKWNK